MRMKLVLSTMGAALLAALASPGQATVLPYKSLQALIDESDGIVVASVRAVQAAAAASHDVNTFVTLDRIEVLSGRLDTPTLTLKMRGGLVDGRGLHVDGVPSLQPDERVLLFVQGNGRDLVPLVGWSQGLFRLVTDLRSGQSYVQDADGHEVVGLADGQVERQAGAQLDVVLLGAPEVQRVRQPQPEAGGGQTEDGSPVTPLGVQAAPKQPISAEHFVAEMRRRAAGHAGKTLRSVTPERVAAETSAHPDAVPLPRPGATAAALLALAGSAAHAATWLECEGNKIKWNSGWTNMYISTTSFPAGSTWDADLQNAMWHWNNVKAAGFNFYVGRDSDGTHAKDNGVNEIYLHGTEVGSALAVTFSRYHCYWLFGYQYGLDEADVAGSAFKRTGSGTTGLVSSPSSAARGWSVSIGYTFANLGTATATFNIGFYLSTNAIISSSDRLLGSNTGAWASPGAIGSYSRTLTIPADVAPGTYYLGFLLDKDGQIGEANEGNNGQPMPRAITIY